MNGLDNFFRFRSIKLLPALKELDETVTFIEVSSKESLYIFEFSWLHKLTIGLEGADQIRNPRFCRV